LECQFEGWDRHFIDCNGWDTHSGDFPILKDYNLPQFDQTLSILLADSDSQAAYVKDRPVRPADICASVYQCLGIDPDMPILDRSGRPVPVAQGGQAIREVLA
jgi:hypothetical protein